MVSHPCSLPYTSLSSTAHVYSFTHLSFTFIAVVLAVVFVVVSLNGDDASSTLIDCYCIDSGGDGEEEGEKDNADVCDNTETVPQ